MHVDSASTSTRTHFSSYQGGWYYVGGIHFSRRCRTWGITKAFVESRICQDISRVPHSQTHANPDRLPLVEYRTLHIQIDQTESRGTKLKLEEVVVGVTSLRWWMSNETGDETGMRLERGKRKDKFPSLTRQAFWKDTRMKNGEKYPKGRLGPFWEWISERACQRPLLVRWFVWQCGRLIRDDGIPKTNKNRAECIQIGTNRAN